MKLIIEIDLDDVPFATDQDFGCELSKALRRLARDFEPRTYSMLAQGCAGSVFVPERPAPRVGDWRSYDDRPEGGEG